MKPELIELLKDLADALEKHGGGLSYKTSDNGIYVFIGEDLKNDVCIGWPMCGDVKELRQIIEANAKHSGSSAGADGCDKSRAKGKEMSRQIDYEWNSYCARATLFPGIDFESFDQFLEWSGYKAKQNASPDDADG